MPDFQPPQWSEFKVPGGGADLSYVGPVANAYSEAARMAVNPLQRAFEQALAQKMQERMATREMQFREQQANRQYEEQTMLQKMQDAAALKRIEAEIEGRKQIEQLGIERKGAAALALRDLMDPMLMQGQQGGAPQGAQGVQPGTGPLSLESMAQLPPQAGAGSFPPLSIDDATAKALGPEGVEGAVRTWASERERKTNNAEQAAKDARAQATAQAQMQAVGTTIAQAPIPPDVKAALMARAQGGDPDGAAGQLADFLKPAPPRQKTASELENDKLDRFEANFGGGTIYLPNSLAKGSDAYIKANGALSKLPADGKAALTLQAQEIVNKTIRATDPVMAAVLDGTMTTKDEKLKAAIKASYDNRVNEQIPLLAQTLGWKTDEQLLAEGMAASAPPAPSPAPVAAAPASEPPTMDGMRQFLGGVQAKYGILPEEVKAFNDELRALIDAGKREEAAKLLKSRYDKRMSDSAKQGWAEPPTPPPAPIDRWTHGPG